MPMIVIQHKVASFEDWKKSFDSDPLGRAQNGVTGHAIHRPASDPNQVVIHLEFASLEQAQSFLLKLREMWRQVGDKIGLGSADDVQAHVLVEVEQTTY